MTQDKQNQISSSDKVRAVWIDRGVRLFLGMFFALSAGAYGKNALHEMQHLHDSGFSFATFSNGLAIFAVSVYSFTIACLYALRHRPTNKFVGWWPSLSALVGGFLGMALILLPQRHDLPLPLQVLGSLMVFIGMGLTACILTHLGRSFSILPESRKLVRHGAYKYIRHPLYLSEALATFGMLINFLSISAAIIVFAQFAFQFVRMHYEEKVLRENFPEYADYARETARLIPGLY